MLRILYGLMIMTISKEDNSSSDTLNNWPQPTPTIKITVTLFQDALFFCSRMDVSWWKRSTLKSPHRQLISTRNGKIMRSLESKYSLVNEEFSKNSRRSQLLLKNATVHDEGYYECECIHRIAVANNEPPTIRQQQPKRYRVRYKLEVLAPVSSVLLTAPTKSSNPHNAALRLTSGENVEIACVTKGVKPKAELGFHPHGLVLEKMTTWLKTPDGLFTSTITGKLRINQNLHGETIGCWAHNQLGNVSSNNFKIEVLSTPKCVHDDIKLINVSVNSRILINCTMTDAHPKIDRFYWNFGSDAIDYDHGLYSQDSAFASTKISFDMVYSSVICTGHNSVGYGTCRYQLQLGGVPDPPFGCSSTQTNTTLTISCKAGFHQGDPDYFCYLELFDRIAQQFVEIARKKQSCVFLLTEFRPQGIHTYRLYTENRHGSNKADSIIIRIGEEKVPKSNERWKIMSITLGILAGVSALVLIGFIIYRMAMPVTDFSTLIESNRRDLYSNDQKQLDRIYLPSSRIRRGSQSMGRYLRNDQHGTSCDDSFRRPRSYPFNHELSHSTDELTRGAKYNAGAQNDPSLALQRRASENRAYVISDCRLTATRNKSLTVDNVSYANTNTRLCKYTMYNPKSEDSLLCEHRQTNHPLGNRGLPPLHPQHHHHNHSQSVKIFDHHQHQQQPHSGQSSSLTFKAAITSRRCEDGGVFV